MAGQHIKVTIVVEKELGGAAWVPVKWEAVFPESNGPFTRVRPLEVTNWSGDTFDTEEAAVQSAKRQARRAIRDMGGQVSEDAIIWEVQGATAGPCEMVEG